jgi:hypothetical protein
MRFSSIVPKMNGDGFGFQSHGPCRSQTGPHLLFNGGPDRGSSDLHSLFHPCIALPPDSLSRGDRGEKSGLIFSTIKLHWKTWDKKFKYFLVIITLFTLGNSSDAFLLLRAKDLGIDILSIPILWFVFHLSKTIFSIPGGSLSDRIGRRRVMMLAWTLYGLVYLGFGFASNHTTPDSSRLRPLFRPMENGEGLGQTWWRN